MATRYNINDFALANPIYVGATVSFFTVSGGAKTSTLATLYAASTGSTTLTNPRTLDSDGKFSAPVYVEVPVIATVSGLTVADHDTGIMGLAEGAASASATAAAASEDAAAVSAQAALDSEVAAAASAASISLPLPVASGGTASTTAAAARTSLGVKLQGGKGGCISNMGGSNPFSQCHLVPRNGNTLLINGELQTIPAGALSVSGGVQATYTSCYLNGTPGQSLAANTDYYIYAAMSGSTMILDFSATIPDVDSTYGIMVKTGDATRTLVGFLHTDASIKTLGSANAQTIISYYNRLRYRLETSIDGSTTAGAWEELNTANRLHWCQWSEDLPVGPSAHANWGSTVSGDRVAMGIGLASASPWSTPSSPNGYTGAAVINGTASGSTAITARAQNPGSAIGGYMWCNLLAFRQGGSGTCSIYGSAAMLLDNNAV